nr:hypothetical protein [Morchella crassipes]
MIVEEGGERRDADLLSWGPPMGGVPMRTHGGPPTGASKGGLGGAASLAGAKPALLFFEKKKTKPNKERGDGVLFLLRLKPHKAGAGDGMHAATPSSPRLPGAGMGLPPPPHCDRVPGFFLLAGAAKQYLALPPPYPSQQRPLLASPPLRGGRIAPAEQPSCTRCVQPPPRAARGGAIPPPTFPPPPPPHCQLLAVVGSGKGGGGCAAGSRKEMQPPPPSSPSWKTFP